MAATPIGSDVTSREPMKKLVADILKDSKVLGPDYEWISKGDLDAICDRYENVRLVKTIWQFAEPIDLLEFYCPTRVVIEGKRKIIKDLSEFGYDGNIVVQGTVGQGKSIFFRYLTSVELYRGEVIPIFVELRRIEHYESLVEFLIKELKSRGLNIDEKIFEVLAKNGRIALFLDGFDEVKEVSQSKLFELIENLVKQYKNLRTIISSRPGSRIVYSSSFRVIDLSRLEGREYQDVVLKVTEERDIAAHIIESVEQSNNSIKQLLTTPLMVALLVQYYRYSQSVPHNIIEFYKKLFDVLISSHDKSKAWNRPKKSGLSDTDLQRIFEALCFISRMNDNVIFTSDQLTTLISHAIQVWAKHHCKSQDVIDDIVTITCLIIEEGGKFQFIHNSIQEFYAASYIEKIESEKVARELYSSIGKRSYKWLEELSFLRMIDGFRFKKFFMIPEIRRLLSLKNRTIPERLETKDAHVLRLFPDFFVSWSNGKFDTIIIKRNNNRWIMQYLLPNYETELLKRMNLNQIQKEIDNGDFRSQVPSKNNEFYNSFISAKGNYRATLRDLIKSSGFRDDIFSLVSDVIHKLLNELRSAEKYVKDNEVPSPLLDHLKTR